MLTITGRTALEGTRPVTGSVARSLPVALGFGKGPFEAWSARIRTNARASLIGKLDVACRKTLAAGFSCSVHKADCDNGSQT